MAKSSDLTSVRFDNVVGISWPRSGHHMLVRLLTLYFGDSFGYCEFHAGTPNLSDITECCRTVPCRHADRIALTKNHDFDLQTPQIEGQKYLVQYRDFVPSVVSNFELHVRNGAPDTEDSFRHFASMEFTRYRAFMFKWVYSDFASDQLLLDYNGFIADPQGYLGWAVAFLAPEHEIDHDRLADAVARVDGERIEKRRVEALAGIGVHQPRDVTQFRHYKPGLFADLDRLSLDRWEVIDAFESLLGRKPPEKAILSFQCFETSQALQAHLMESPEYKSRVAQGLAGTQPDSDNG